MVTQASRGRCRFRAALSLGLMLLSVACHRPTAKPDADPHATCGQVSAVEASLPAVKAWFAAQASSEMKTPSVHQQDALLEGVQLVHLPGLLTLLAAGQSHPADTGQRDPQHQPTVLLDPLTREALKAKLLEKARGAIDDKTLSLPGVPGIALSKHEVEQAMVLLESGRFESDVRDVVATALDAGFQLLTSDKGELVRALLGKGPGAISREWLCLEGLQHTGCMWREWPSVAKSLLKGESVAGRGLYRETLRVLADTDVGRASFTTVARLLDNETVRLALVLYARTQGVAISDEQLQQVGQFFHADASGYADLATLLGPALSTVAAKYHGDEAVALVRRLANRFADNGCRASL